MDSRKHALPEQLLSPGRKTVSGFGLWGGASLIIFSVFFIGNSLNGRVVITPLKGVNSVGVNSSFVPWPFAYSSSYGPVSVSNNASAAKQVQSSMDSESKPPEANKALGVAFDATHLGNLTGKSKNGSFSVEEGRVQQKSHEEKSWNFSDSAGDGKILGRGNLGKFPGTVQGKSLQNSSFMNKTVIRENNTEGNLSYNGGVGGFQGVGEKRVAKNQTTISYKEECDIFDGRWVRDDSKPYYPAGSCPHIGRDFDCHLNGRPDSGFVKWRWQPNGCDIPSLNATDFLERLRGKKLVFVGDSLNRNMWESLVCILRHSIRNKKRVYEISGRTEFKKKGFYAFRFEDYNCTVDFVVSPFLVRESSFKRRNGTIETLRLDLMDRTTSMYHDADVIIFNTGHWWTHEKTSRGEDYYQEGNHVYPRLKVLEAYKRALMTWVRWIDKNIDSSRTHVFFRGYSVTHFRGGQWNSGGQCHKETEPIFNQAHLAKYPSKMRALEHVLQVMKTPVTYLNISRLTDYRKDGHPSIYRMQYKTADERIAAEGSQDCSHWCLPGVPDTWNELLYASLLKAGWGS